MVQDTEKTLQQLEQDPVLRHFLNICKYPHPSHKEKALSDYLLSWGKQQGLVCMQGTELEVYLRRPASSGFEEQPTLLLQAHMDMVCQTAPGVQHDFDHEPIRPVREGDLLTTGGRTTLGADNGLGVALAMAALTENIPHPPLEVLFTTAEEDDFAGAKAAQGKWFKARRMINLDNSVENEIIVGSCGGVGAEVTFPAERQAVPAGCAAVRLEIEGLQGGHSGEDVHRGRGSANILLARLLSVLAPLQVQVSELQGGSCRVALPRSAYAVLVFSAGALPELRRLTAEYEEIFRREYKYTAPALTVNIKDTDCPARAVSAADTQRLVQALLLLPNGIREMNGAYREVVEASCNLGEVYLEEAGFRIVAEVRAAHESMLEWQIVQSRAAAALLGGRVRLFGDYPGWTPNPDSQLLQLAAEKMEQEYKKPPVIRAIHAGLEGGAMCRAIPGLDVISIGAAHWGLHSPNETASIPSVQRTWRVLQAILFQKV